MTDKVAVLGAGSWGMAVARLLYLKGMAVTLWEFDRGEYEKLLFHRGNPEKLPGLKLPDGITITNDLEESVTDCPFIVLAVPSQKLRSVVVRLRDLVDPDAELVNLAKGIETRTLKRMSEVIGEELRPWSRRVVTLSGPSHAEEVIIDVPTAVVAAGEDEDLVLDAVDGLLRENIFLEKSIDIS